MPDMQLRHDIVQVARWVHERGWTTANSGNLSARISDGNVICTPTKMSKGSVTEDDLVICDLQGRKVGGGRSMTSEILLHLTVYRSRPDVMAVLHVHSPYATGFAVAGRSLNRAVLPEAIVQLGVVPVSKYALPGSPALSTSLEPYIPHHDAILMGNHGVISYGDSIQEAFLRTEIVEHVAQVTFIAESLGGPRILSRQEIHDLVSARNRYAAKARDSSCVDAFAEEDSQRDTMRVSRRDLSIVIDEILHRGAAG